MLTRLDQVTSEEINELPWQDYGVFLAVLVDTLNTDLDNIETKLNDLTNRIVALGG